MMFDIKKVYGNQKEKSDGTTYKDNSSEIEKIFKYIDDDADFNDVDKMALMIRKNTISKRCPDGYANKTLGDAISALGTFMSLLDEEQLKLLKIKDVDALASKRDGAKGTYHVKADLLCQQAKDERASGKLTEKQEIIPSMEVYNAFVDKHVEIINEMLLLVNIFNDEDLIKKFYLSFLVIFHAYLPNMRSSPANLRVDMYDKNLNFVLDAPNVRQIVMVYNRHKNKDGLIVHSIMDDELIYKAIIKLLEICRKNKCQYLFYNFDKDEPLSEDDYRRLVLKAHDELKVGLRLLRVLDESIELEGIGGLHDREINARKRGHSFIQALHYAKKLKR